VRSVFRTSFRTRLLVALLGCVALLLGLTMVFVHGETARQVASFEERTTARAGEAFEQLERLWQDRLAGAALRLGSSQRIRAVLAEGDVAELHSVAADELVVAAIPDALAVFTDVEGEPLAALLDGGPIPVDRLTMDPWLERLIAGEARVFGYEVVDGRLFVVHADVLVLFRRPLGVLLLGFPVRDDDARRLAGILDAEVCFVVGRECAAATAAARHAGFEPMLVESADRGSPGPATHDRARWALIPQRLTPAGGTAAASVIAVPLDPVLAPFERIQRVAGLAGAFALLLAAILATVLSRGLTRPVERLVAATRRVARGEYDVRVPVRANDEIGTLGAAFNRMAEGLQLKERYRGVLDKVVSPEVAEELLKGEIRLGGETREVTTLFADIRGFTSRTEGMEPQSVIALLNDYLGRATAAVEAEGGVVDKYVGDEVIALFGAPIAREDDTLRAVRAGLAIQAAVRELNEERSRRGESAVEVGIGINTGTAVAGNMGSSRRMNYTVVGESVNLTARLCSAAGPGEVLVSEATWQRVRDRFIARELPAIRVKGLSYEVRVRAVEGERTARGGPDRLRAGAGGLAVLVGLLATAGPLPGQNAPAFHYQLSGRLELEGFVPQESPPWIIEETSPFLAGRASLFAIGTLGDRLSGLLEARADRGQVPGSATLEARLQQAFLHYTIGTALGLGVQAGKFVSPLGIYARRHRTPADPFVRPPLVHDHRTIVSATFIPGAIDGFLDWKDEPIHVRQRGAPLVWAVPYPAGAFVESRFDAIDVTLAVLNSAPSSGPAEWVPRFDAEPVPSLIVHAGYRLRPELRLGVSYGVGGYLAPVLEDSLPAGTTRRDFVQELWNANAAFSRGRVEAHAEVFLNRWEVPRLEETPRDLGYYAEAKVRLIPGAYVAGRYNGIRFNQMTRSSGVQEPWDHDVERWQVAGGYRLTRDSELRAEYMVNRSAAPAGAAANLLSLQLWWSF
jgi:class 3 adenylate cyclase/HAMP domain-containing protein